MSFAYQECLGNFNTPRVHNKERLYQQALLHTIENLLYFWQFSPHIPPIFLPISCPCVSRRCIFYTRHILRRTHGEYCITPPPPSSDPNVSWHGANSKRYITGRKYTIQSSRTERSLSLLSFSLLWLSPLSLYLCPLCFSFPLSIFVMSVKIITSIYIGRK